MSTLTSSARRRVRSLTAGGVLAFPLLLGQCQPGCDPSERWIETRQLGTSIEGRPITALSPRHAWRQARLVVGSIHGDQQAGIEIAEHVRDAAAIPAGLDVWVISTINPDGNVIDDETNANRVDLNRNFPTSTWTAIDCQAVPLNCSGPSPGSEPETKAVVALVDEIQPRVTIWYQAVGPVVDKAAQFGVNKPAVLAQYAEEVGYSVATLSCGIGGCTGNARQYQNEMDKPGTPSSAFVVELSTRMAGGINATGVTSHAEGIWAAAAVA